MEDEDFHKENPWFYLKGECYQSLNQIEEFKAIQEQQETKSVCSYIVDRSSTYSSGSAYSGSYLDQPQPIYKPNSNSYNYQQNQSTVTKPTSPIDLSSESNKTTNSYDNVNNVNSNNTSAYLAKDSIWSRDDHSDSSKSALSSYVQFNAYSSDGDKSLNNIISYIKDADDTWKGSINQTPKNGYIESNFNHDPLSPPISIQHLNNSTQSSPLFSSGSSSGALSGSQNSSSYIHNFRGSSNGVDNLSTSYLGDSGSSQGSLTQSKLAVNDLLTSYNQQQQNKNNDPNQNEKNSKQELPWNESFQQLLDQPVKSLEDEKTRNQSISYFSQMLANQAMKYVKTLVKEVHLMPSIKTIQPCSHFGGIAGGEKYRIDNMFIKFALNPYGIYEQNNPTSYFANKSAGHELKSINALVSCGVPNLHFPLLCLLNYRGFRLSVISELPISSNTIAFGSSDAGLKIHHDPTVYSMMVKIGELLNLKNHQSYETKRLDASSDNATTPNKTQPFQIPLAVDIEGHFGYDGRYYLVDAARLFPCEDPAPGITGGFLFRLLRGEFVKKYEKPLSSDSFSNFNLVASERENELVIKASKYLVQTTIPKFVEDVLIFVNPKRLSVKDLLQKEGINLRYLGLVLYYTTINKKMCAKKKEKLLVKFSIEMLSRLVRFIVFTEMRRLNEKEDEPHLLIAITHLNLLLSNHLSGNSVYLYWSEFISNSLISKYTLSFHQDTLPIERLNVTNLIKNSKGLHQYINLGGKIHYKLLKKIIQLTGIIISPSYLNMIKTSSDPSKAKIINPLKLSDIQEIQVTVKYMKVLSSFKTFEQFSDAEKYYKNELEFKIEKLGKNNSQVALTHIHLSDLYGSYAILGKSEEHLTIAIDIYKSRFGLEDISTITAMEKLALLNIKQKLYDKSANIFKQVLELKKTLFSRENSNKIQGMIEIADTYDNIAWCHQNKGEIKESLQAYSEALRIKLENTGNSMTTAKTLNNLGHLFLSTNDSVKALEIFTKVRDIFIQHKGIDHIDVATAYDNLGMVYSKLKKYADGEKSFRSAIVIRSKQFGSKSRLVALTQDHLAQLYVAWDKSKYVTAEKLFIECIEIVDQSPDYYSRAFFRYNLSKLYRIQRNKTNELKFLNNSLQIFELHNISTDLLPKIRSRIESLSKSGFSKVMGWISNPKAIKTGPLIAKYTHSHDTVGIVESQQAFGHMEMSSNKFVDNSIPKEWQDILNEVGITNEQLMDPAYANTIHSIIKEACGGTAASVSSPNAGMKSKVMPRKTHTPGAGSTRNRALQAKDTIATIGGSIQSKLSTSSESIEKELNSLTKEVRSLSSNAPMKKSRPAISKTSPPKTSPPLSPVSSSSPPPISPRYSPSPSTGGGGGSSRSAEESISPGGAKLLEGAKSIWTKLSATKRPMAPQQGPSQVSSFLAKSSVVSPSANGSSLPTPTRSKFLHSLETEGIHTNKQLYPSLSDLTGSEKTEKLSSVSNNRIQKSDSNMNNNNNNLSFLQSYQQQVKPMPVPQYPSVSYPPPPPTTQSLSQSMPTPPPPPPGCGVPPSPQNIFYPDFSREFTSDLRKKEQSEPEPQPQPQQQQQQQKQQEQQHFSTPSSSFTKNLGSSAPVMRSSSFMSNPSYNEEAKESIPYYDFDPKVHYELNIVDEEKLLKSQDDQTTTTTTTSAATTSPTMYESELRSQNTSEIDLDYHDEDEYYEEPQYDEEYDEEIYQDDSEDSEEETEDKPQFNWPTLHNLVNKDQLVEMLKQKMHDKQFK